MIEPLFRLEYLGLFVLCAAAFLLCRKGSSALRGPRRAFGWLARRRWLAVVLVGLLAVAAAASLTPLVCRPLPNYHDEFSYLLAADTFAHGRLANPPHPLWIHFETFHVIHEPTYASKYPPGQGLILALGQVLGGSPVVGVWISMGLCCGGICWMLQGWLPPRWALAGALLFTGKLVFCGEYGGTVGYWGQSYWGGAVAACGGALVFGALRRLARRPATATSVTLGVGLVVLANSRPYEGLVICLPVAAVLLTWLVRSRGAEAWALAHRVWLPLALVLLAGAGCMARYNERVTGHPLRMPYVWHESIYAVAPSFIWQPLRPEPPYNHPVVREFWTGWACEDYNSQRSSLRLFVLHHVTKVERLWFFFFGISLSVPFLASWRARSDHWFLFALGSCGLLFVVLMLHVGVQPHYAAPATCLVAFLVTALLRRLSAWRYRGVPVGRALAVGVVANCVLVMVASIAFAQKRVIPDAWYRERDRVASQVADEPGQHLVIVHYGPDHVVDEEWVYNEADLDGSRVVWARSMNAQADRRLLAYFAGRRVWRLDADAVPPRLEPYPAEPPQRDR
jgi:hypothetical protein